MNMSLNRYWLGGLSAALLSIGVFCSLPLVADDDDDDAQEEEIAVEELPEAIRDALSGVEIDEAERVARGDRVIFEVAIEVGEAEFELQLTRDARLVGVEVEEGEDEEGDDDEEEGEDDDDDEDGDDDEDRL
jgi:hypothetical protein